MARRLADVIAVIAAPLARQQHMPGVVIIIIPLRPVFSPRRIHSRIEQACTVIIILQHEMNHAAAVGGKAAYCVAELMQDGRLSRLDDRQKSLAEDMNPYHSPYLFPAVRWSLMDM